MHYPHEREERKVLFSALIDHSRSDLFLESVAALILGSCVIGVAILDSALVHSAETISAWSWLLVWTISLFATALFCFILPKLLPSQRDKKLFGIKRSFVIKTTFPSFLIGAVSCWSIGTQSSSHLPLAACIGALFYSLSLFSRVGFSMPALKNYAIAIAISALSLMVITLRYRDLPILPQHLANLFLISTLGFPSIAFGAWVSFIKKN